jgi:hypothetical protein
MRLWIRSDLHCSLPELADSFDAAPPHDVCVLAGDLAAGLVRQIEVLDSVATKPVILVAGNHEFYGRSWLGEIMAATIAAKRSRRVRFLEVDQAVIAGVRFIGGTMWTDFDLYGSDTRSLAMAHAQAHNPDFSSIFCELSWAPGTKRLLFTPDHAKVRHLDTTSYIDGVMAQPFNEPTVIVSHHAPSLRSVAPHWRSDQHSPAFASRLDTSIERWNPALWIHGHVHDSFDYRIGETRVVCNPQGFHGENGAFDPDLVVDG